MAFLNYLNNNTWNDASICLQGPPGPAGNDASLTVSNNTNKLYVLGATGTGTGISTLYTQGTAIYMQNNVLQGAAWNDYAEYRKTEKNLKPGTCVIEVGDGSLIPSTERLQRGASIVSDTFGFAIGKGENAKTPIAVCGRVLAYTYQDKKMYQAGDPVCTAPNGTIDKMTDEEVRQYPDRILGYVSEIPTYMIWKGEINIAVNDRIWIKVR